jgi:hypothetical protein
MPSILSQDECNAMNKGMWDALSFITKGKVRREAQDSWNNFYTCLADVKHSMLIQNYGIGHAPYVWELRQNEKIINVFCTLCNAAPSDLLVSFDGIACHLPPEFTRRGWLEKAHKIEMHVDQSYLRNDLESYQSWVTANDVLEGDATLQVLKGSHLLHEEFAQQMDNATEKDWYRLSKEEEEWYTERCEKVRIACPRGSLVLWDSRTIHSGLQASKQRHEPNIRNVAYLCYTPRSRATPQVIQKRIKWFENAEMTSHCPHNPRKFAKQPHVRSKEQKDYNVFRSPPQLSEIGLRLVGYD